MASTSKKPSHCCQRGCSTDFSAGEVSSSSGGGGGGGGLVDIPVLRDLQTFSGLQQQKLKDIEKCLEAEKRKKQKNWSRAVAQMKKEFLKLYAIDYACGAGGTPPTVTSSFDDKPISLNNSDSRIEGNLRDNRGEKRLDKPCDKVEDKPRNKPEENTPRDKAKDKSAVSAEPWVLMQIGQLDVLDRTKMKTMLMEYPDVVGKRFRLRFDVSELDQKTVRVTTDVDRISVVAMSPPEQQIIGEPLDPAVSPSSAGGRKLYARHIAKPPEVDETRMKSYLTSDGILIVEAPVRSFAAVPSTLPIVTSPVKPDHGSSSSVGSAGTVTPGGSSGKEKIGVPVFRDEDGQRIMQLIVDMGKWFQPGEVVVEVVKEDRVLVTAKCKHKTEERWTKCKFCKEYELTEKIDKHSLRAGLQSDGRLIVSAFSKKRGAAVNKALISVVKSFDEMALLPNVAGEQ